MRWGRVFRHETSSPGHQSVAGPAPCGSASLRLPEAPERPTVNSTLPFQERKSPIRGALDLLTGRYPRFLFGGGLGSCLPVFHFHGAHPGFLEPYLRFLSENGYRTATSETVADLVLRGQRPPPRTVALCFDDAWSSLWIVAVPLLRRYGFRAIAYVSPARISDASAPRAQHLAGPLPAEWAAMDRNDPPFCTWCELKAMDAAGVVDVQAHSWRHAKVFASEEVVDFIRPGQLAGPHDVPLLDTPGGMRFATRADLGAPLYAARARLSDAFRWIAPEAFDAAVRHVRDEGGQAFFDRPQWRDELREIVRKAPPGRWETAAERETSIAEELARAREILEQRLAKPVRHMCFPWAIAGGTAVRLAEKAGYQTAFSDRLGGIRSVRPGDPPFQLMRLKHPLIFCLPGKGRTWFFGRRPPVASRGLDERPSPLPPERPDAP